MLLLLMGLALQARDLLTPAARPVAVAAAVAATAATVVVPNPGPIDPTGGAAGIGLLLSYAKWAALIACGLSAVCSGGLMAIGSLSNRPDHAERGKRAFLWSIGGVIASAIAIPMVNSVFQATS